MQRIFTLEGNIYSNQTEFQTILKDVLNGLNKNKEAMKSYESFKKEEEISLKEIDVIHLKITQEIQRMTSFFEKDLALQVNVKKFNKIYENQQLSEYMSTNNKLVPRLFENDFEELEQNDFNVIKNSYEIVTKQANNFSNEKSALAQQRLVDIQNLNPNINNNNSTPVTKLPLPNCSGFSNQKGLSSAQTKTSLTKSDSKSKCLQFINKSLSNSEIKGYNLLSSQKININTPKATISEKDSNFSSSNKKNFTTSIFPESNSKVLTPSEKTMVQSNKLAYSTNQIAQEFSQIQEYITESSKNQTGNSLMRKESQNQDLISSSFQKRKQIKSIGGDLSPINKTEINLDNFEQTAYEIMQENCIEWVHQSNEDDFIDRGNNLRFERNKLNDEFEGGGKNDQKKNDSYCFNESQDLQKQEENYDHEQYDFKKQEDDYIESDVDEDEKEGFNFDDSIDYEKEDQNIKPLKGKIQIRKANKQEQNVFEKNKVQSLKINKKNSQLQVYGNNEISNNDQFCQSQEIPVHLNKKQKRLRKRVSKKNKRLRLQQQQMVEHQSKQIQLSQQENKLNVTEFEKGLQSEQILHKEISSSYSATKNKNQQLKDEVIEIKQKQQKLSINKNKIELSLQNHVESLYQKSSISNKQYLKSDSTEQQNPLQLKSSSKKSSIPVLDSSQYFDGNNSPSLSTFSHSEEHFNTKKKLKTSNKSNLEDQLDSSIQNTPTIVTKFNLIKESQNNCNKSLNSQCNENYQTLKQSGNQITKQDKIFVDNEKIQQENYSNIFNYSAKNNFNNQQSTYNHQYNINKNQPTTFNFNQQTIQSIIQQPLTNQSSQSQQFNNSLTSQQRNQQLKYLGVRQQQSNNQQNQPLTSQETMQTLQESYQGLIQFQQSQITARQNSLIRPRTQQNNNYELFYNNTQPKDEILTPKEEIIYDNRNQLELQLRQQRYPFQSANTVGQQSTFSNRYSTSYQYSFNNHSRKRSRQKYNNSNVQKYLQNSKQQNLINNQETLTMEQIQEQIDFSNQLKDQLEKKMQEEQINNLKYSQCSSTKRLKFQILNDYDQPDKVNNDGYNYSSHSYQGLQNQIINNKYIQNDSMSSPNLENERNSGFDNDSPILYSPRVQFSPVDSGIQKYRN